MASEKIQPKPSGASTDDVQAVERLGKAHAKILAELRKMIVGMDQVIDEMMIAGFLRGSPVEMVKCETSDLEVPANAEIVIEGELLPGVRRTEGPFGEFPGYYQAVTQQPVFKLKAITHRRDVLHQSVLHGTSNLARRQTSGLRRHSNRLQSQQVPLASLACGNRWLYSPATVDRRRKA